MRSVNRHLYCRLPALLDAGLITERERSIWALIASCFFGMLGQRLADDETSGAQWKANLERGGSWGQTKAVTRNSVGWIATHEMILDQAKKIHHVFKHYNNNTKGLNRKGELIVQRPWTPENPWIVEFENFVWGASAQGHETTVEDAVSKLRKKMHMWPKLDEEEHIQQVRFWFGNNLNDSQCNPCCCLFWGLPWSIKLFFPKKKKKVVVFGRDIGDEDIGDEFED